MTYTRASLDQFLETVWPFDQLSPTALQSLTGKCQQLRYRIGQPILRRESLPHQVVIIMEGQARLLGYDPYTQNPMTLARLSAGDVLGVAGLVRRRACEGAIASSEMLTLTLPAAEFQRLLETQTAFAQAVRERCYLAELFELMGNHYKQQAATIDNLSGQVQDTMATGVAVQQLEFGRFNRQPLDAQRTWFISQGKVSEYGVGEILPPEQAQLQVLTSNGARIVGIPTQMLSEMPTAVAPEVIPDPVDTVPSQDHIPYAADVPATASFIEETPGQRATNYPLIRGRGELDASVACFEMIAQHLNMPFKRDVVRRVLSNQKERLGQLSLPSCGAVADLLGLKPQLAKVPATAIGRLPKLALIQWRDSFAVLYETSEKECIIGFPEERRLIRHSPQAFAEIWGNEGEVLMLEPTSETPQQRFGLSWFWPSIQKYRGVLSLVLAASFFYQLLGLANPLLFHQIIDQVIGKNSIDTLYVLGTFMLIAAVFEALLGSLRTYLFVDTTNRIDLTLASQTIDHLLRLPLKYFDRRPVGELSSRVNELENIRQFLTGTALTVVLDAIFSVLYIAVLMLYSVKLTLVTLLTIPLFVVLTIFVSPIVRRQLRAKAERNAETQSFLVEALSGVQTVKAQNIELNTRWKWQSRYARYVSDGFKTTLTSTTAGSVSGFLNKLSGLLVICVGAFLVLNGELTLGGLIAFRIISGYITQPLLRLTQLWQNFQETALSLERLSDIIDHPQEQEAEQRSQIPMPEVTGNVKYENISFRFAASGPLQLANINIDFEAGQFVGIVGQSGSGKSTMMKLLPRLYNPDAGRILIDGYDISKVELYSLRQQVGIVPQDSLLFEGTVQENIALTNTAAETDTIIEAAQIACAHDFIMELPVGYNSRVGERGSSLSGGQRQRIAIARTIVQNPRLLILDEATSALDYDTEAQVSANLMKWAKGRTVFFITHRLGALRHADKILVMEKGAIVEVGTHDELVDLKGRYYCLLQQQGNG